MKRDIPIIIRCSSVSSDDLSDDTEFYNSKFRQNQNIKHRSSEDIYCDFNYSSSSSFDDSYRTNSSRDLQHKKNDHLGNCDLLLSTSASSSNDSSQRNLNFNGSESKINQRNKSLSSIAKLFNNLSLKSWRLTKSITKTPEKKSKKQISILRRPSDYYWTKGISGLHTIRVEKSSLCCQHRR